MMLQRLLDRLHRRQRVVQLLLARQPMLRRTVIGRRMVRAFGTPLAEPLGSDRAAFAPGIAPFTATTELADPNLALPSVAELLPEPLPEPVVGQPAQLPMPDSPGTVIPSPVTSMRQVAASPTAPMARSQEQVPRQAAPITNPQQSPGPTVSQSAPAVRGQQQAPPILPVVDVQPETHMARSLDAVPEQAPFAPASVEPTRPPEQIATPPTSGQLAPLADTPGRSAPASPDVAPPNVQNPPARRRRAQIIEMPVSPEVARSLAQAAGERYIPPPSPSSSTQSSTNEPNRPSEQASSPFMPPQDAELFTSTPARSPQEWGRLLFGGANAETQPDAAADVVGDVNAETQPDAAVADPQRDSAFAPEPAVADVDLAATMPFDDGSASVGTLHEPMLAENPVAPISFVPIVDAPTADIAPIGIPLAPARGSNAPAPELGLPASVAQPEISPLSVPAALPMPLPTNAPGMALPASSSQTPAVSAMQRSVERVADVLRRDAQVQQPADPATPYTDGDPAVVDAQSSTQTIASAEQSGSRPIAQAEIQPGIVSQAPVVDPVVSVPQFTADPASTQAVPDPMQSLGTPPVAESSAAPIAPEQPGRRRSRFEEIPASARQPVPQPVRPSAERQLNPRPWIPQPKVAPIPEDLPETILQDSDGRGPQDWAKLLFQATNPQSWGRQPQPAPEPLPMPTPLAPDVSAQPVAPANAPVSTATQRQDVNRPAAAQVVRPPTAPTVPQTQHQAPRAPAQLPQATPLRESTRRFLRPIVGIDPNDVRIYRGAEGARITEAFQAEGVSSGDAIALGPGHEDESRPQTLGLLAHELTHAARSGDTQFVPPIAEGMVSPTAGEEQVARAAEQQALGAARRFVAPVAAAASIRPPDTPRAAASSDTNSLFGDVRSAQAEPDQIEWGDLPAPWEPLPDWIGGRSQAPETGPSSEAVPVLPMPAAVPTSSMVPAVPATYLAEVDREISSGEAIPAPQQQQQAAPAADLDAMARQVYGMLKQRLAAERRRLG